jgi:AcrR family transcriptional regulator
MPGKTRDKTLKPRKSPAQKRSAETVETILEAAARILEKAGFAGYNTNAVAARAGVSVGSLYQYFSGKDALTAALIERETTMLLADVTTVAIATTYQEALNHLIRAAVTHQMRRPVLARLLDFEERRLPLDERHERVGDRIISALTAVLGRPDAGRFDDIHIIAGDLLALVRGIVDAAGERGETDAPALESRVQRAAFGYLDRCRR